MERVWNHKCAGLLLVSIALFSCGAFASMMMDHKLRASKTRAGAEPFATFHMLDRQLSVLGQQSPALQKTITSPKPADMKAARPAWSGVARQMGQTVAAIEKLALRMQRRYRGKPYGIRLFRRLRARAASVQSAQIGRASCRG